MIHKLGQLAGAEKLFDRCRDRLGIDHLLGHKSLGFSQCQTLLNGALYPNQTDTELVLSHLTDTADAAVAEVVDVIDNPFTVADVDQLLQHHNDIFVGEDTLAGNLFTTKAFVELHATDCREIIAIRAEEEALEQILRRLFGRRLTRAHHAVDLYLGFKLAGSRINTKGGRNIRAVIEIVGEEGLYTLDTLGNQDLKQLLGDLSIGIGNDFTRLLIDKLVEITLP